MKRYDLEYIAYGSEGQNEMRECIEGDWIRYEDVEKLEKENARLRALVKRASKSTSYDDCDCLAVTGRLCFPCECKEALK